MARQQRTFTTEYKLEAVRLAQTSGKSTSQVAREQGTTPVKWMCHALEVSESGYYAWRLPPC